MSFRSLSSLNSPSIITAAGVALAASAPLASVGHLSLEFLQAANLLAFATNVVAVSVPGRSDGAQDAKMRHGDLDPDSTTRLVAEGSNDLNARRGRMMLRPAGWAFAIWGPIYLGEGIFCMAQFVDGYGLADKIPVVTVPFVAANLFQALWCASFRPSYDKGWHKYVSVAMLGGTAVSLSFIPTELSYFFVPMAMHFGWTTAATLVNLNGSLAMEDKVSDSKVIAAGHSSSVLAILLGTGLTLSTITTPIYGFTIAWALAAVAKGVSAQTWSNDTLKTGSKVQQGLCWFGSVLTASAASFVALA